MTEDPHRISIGVPYRIFEDEQGRLLVMPADAGEGRPIEYLQQLKNEAANPRNKSARTIDR